MAPAIHTNTSGTGRGEKGHYITSAHSTHTTNTRKSHPRASKTKKKGSPAGTRTAERSPVVTNKGAKVEAL